MASKIGYNGKFIQIVRERKGISIEDLAKKTRIHLNFLRAIENNNFDQLPAPTFVKGYLQNISKALEIDDRPIVQGYMDDYRRHQ